MKKVFLKFLTCVLISLLSGYGNVYANGVSFQDTAFKNLEQEISIPQNNYTNLDSKITADNALTFKLNDKTELSDNENEEEETSVKIAPLKKLNTLSAYLTHSFYSNTPGYFCEEIKVSLPICKHIFNFPTQKLHVIFRVFRI